MLVRLSTLSERLRTSLFFVPMLFVVAGVALGETATWIDERLVEEQRSLPLGLTSTVDSARAVLGVVASATITFAGIAFSISLLVIQLTSSQYSPRVVPGLFRDPFNKRIMGVVMGTFTFCLVVLRSVRDPIAEGGSAVIPSLSVGIAALLGLVSILAIVAFIDHNAHSMDVSRILGRSTEDALDTVRRLWLEPDPDRDATRHDGDDDSTAGDDEEAHVVLATSGGWIQRIDSQELASIIPEGGTVTVEVEVGRYAVVGTPLVRLTPAPDDPEDAERRVDEAVIVGPARTTEQDVAYGVRQLADVALRALSPGVNDPTTAQDALFHMASVLREALVRDPPPSTLDVDGRTVVRTQAPTPAELVDLGVDEVRLAARHQPTVCIYLLEVLALLLEAMEHAGRGDGPGAEEIRHQASLIRDGVSESELSAHDRTRVEDAFDQRFGGG